MYSKFQTPSAVIIIDAWLDPVGNRPHQMFKHLAEFIQQDFVKCIVVASYAEHKLHGTSATPMEWPIWHNSRRVFNPNLNPQVPAYTGSAWLAQERRQIISNDYHRPVSNQFILHDTPITNPAVLTMSLQQDQKMFAAWTMDQVVYLLNSQYPNIKHIYLCGGAFELCLQDRPIGLKSPAQGDLLSDRLELIDPGWRYNQAQDLIHVQGRALREPTTSKDVLAALDLEQMDGQQAALARVRLETKKRRGLL
jgi:hypothetical protein